MIKGMIKNYTVKGMRRASFKVSEHKSIDVLMEKDNSIVEFQLWDSRVDVCSLVMTIKPNRLIYLESFCVVRDDDNIMMSTYGLEDLFREAEDDFRVVEVV